MKQGDIIRLYSLWEEMDGGGDNLLHDCEPVWGLCCTSLSSIDSLAGVEGIAGDYPAGWVGLVWNVQPGHDDYDIVDEVDVPDWVWGKLAELRLGGSE